MEPPRRQPRITLDLLRLAVDPVAYVDIASARESAWYGLVERGTSNEGLTKVVPSVKASSNGTYR
jgi:hypothetical protein